MSRRIGTSLRAPCRANAAVWSSSRRHVPPWRRSSAGVFFRLNSHWALGTWHFVLRSSFFVLRSSFFVLRSSFFVLRSSFLRPQSPSEAADRRSFIVEHVEDRHEPHRGKQPVTAAAEVRELHDASMLPHQLRLRDHHPNPSAVDVGDL